MDVMGKYPIDHTNRTTHNNSALHNAALYKCNFISPLCQPRPDTVDVQRSGPDLFPCMPHLMAQLRVVAMELHGAAGKADDDRADGAVNDAKQDIR